MSSKIFLPVLFFIGGLIVGAFYGPSAHKEVIKRSGATVTRTVKTKDKEVVTVVDFRKEKVKLSPPLKWGVSVNVDTKNPTKPNDVGVHYYVTDNIGISVSYVFHNQALLAGIQFRF